MTLDLVSAANCTLYAGAKPEFGIFIILASGSVLDALTFSLSFAVNDLLLFLFAISFCLDSFSNSRSAFLVLVNFSSAALFLAAACVAEIAVGFSAYSFFNVLIYY